MGWRFVCLDTWDGVLKAEEKSGVTALFAGERWAVVVVNTMCYGCFVLVISRPRYTLLLSHQNFLDALPYRTRSSLIS